MTQLLQEERDFYKRECELLRNMKEKSVLMSPPTRERVLCSPTLFSPLSIGSPNQNQRNFISEIQGKHHDKLKRMVLLSKKRN